MNVTKGEKQKFNSSYNYQLRNHKDSHQFFDYFLRKEGPNYVFYMLGKNGEPQDDVTVWFSFGHIYMNRKFESGNLLTDNDGRITLGPLNGIYQVTANINSVNGQQSMNWTLNTKQEVVSYPTQINILEGESVELPFTGNKFDESTFALIWTSNQSVVISNNFQNAKFTKKEGFVNGNIQLSGLLAGTYEIKLLQLNVFISLVVHQGVYWETDSFILKKYSLVEARENQSYIRISNLNIAPKKGEDKVSFKVNDFKTNCRVHFYAFQYLPNNIFEVYSKVLWPTNAVSLSIFRFHKWSNFFLSNRKLGDEFRYVFDRKYTQRFMGNQLDRPTLLLKWNFVRDTNFNEEVVQTGS